MPSRVIMSRTKPKTPQTARRRDAAVASASMRCSMSLFRWAATRFM